MKHGHLGFLEGGGELQTTVDKKRNTIGAPKMRGKGIGFRYQEPYALGECKKKIE